MFSGVTLSLVTVPAMLERINGARPAAGGDLNALGGGLDLSGAGGMAGMLPDMRLINGDENGDYDIARILEERERDRNVRTPGQVTRVLGPDE